jgi:LmbE family N-acetylglucosaminyl deacetylase
VLDLPDSGLKEMDPREIEAVVRKEIERVRPDVLVTYPVHGISGFHDHLVMHAVAKRVFVEMRDEGAGPRRLAFCTLAEETAAASPHFALSSSTADEIDCVVRVTDEDLDRTRRALDCYVTFRETIERSGIRDLLPRDQAFEIFDESHDPPLDDLAAF